MLFLSCNAQDKSRNDSLVNASRARVDLVLQKLAISSETLVYSIEDKYYYVAIKNECDYIERYVVLDSMGDIQKNTLLKTRRKDKKILKTAFILENYSNDLSMDIPKASYVRGRTSYFVVRDKNHKRYGEYRLPVFSLPPPINKDVYGYIIKRLSQEMTKD